LTNDLFKKIKLCAFFDCDQKVTALAENTKLLLLTSAANFCGKIAVSG